LPLLAQGFNDVIQGVEQIRNAHIEPNLTIWLAPSFASKWFVPRLNRFADKHPDIDLNISASPNLVDSSAARSA